MAGIYRLYIYGYYRITLVNDQLVDADSSIIKFSDSLPFPPGSKDIFVNFFVLLSRCITPRNTLIFRVLLSILEVPVVFNFVKIATNSAQIEIFQSSSKIFWKFAAQL